MSLCRTPMHEVARHARHMHPTHGVCCALCARRFDGSTSNAIGARDEIRGTRTAMTMRRYFSTVGTMGRCGDKALFLPHPKQNAALPALVRTHKISCSSDMDAFQTHTAQLLLLLLLLLSPPLLLRNDAQECRQHHRASTLMRVT